MERCSVFYVRSLNPEGEKILELPATNDQELYGAIIVCSRAAIRDWASFTIEVGLMLPEEKKS